MKMDKIKKSLDAKLEQDAISRHQLQEGITECFVLTNRNFLRRRMGDQVSTDELDTTTRELVGQVFSENGVSLTRSSPSALRKACQILEDQLGFEADTKLLNRHQQIIAWLFEVAR